MAKRVYKPKVQPLSVQIHIQRANIGQCENALEQAKQMAETSVKHRVGFGGHPLSDAEIEQITSVVQLREQQLADAQQRLAELEAQEV